jgi:hypothetical protein
VNKLWHGTGGEAGSLRRAVVAASSSMLLLQHRHIVSSSPQTRHWADKGADHHVWAMAARVTHVDKNGILREWGAI